MSGDWNYIASRMNGDGTETFLDFELPITDAEITEDLSGPGGITGSITPQVARLLGPDGRPLFEPWSTAIYAEASGTIRGGGLLVDMPEQGPTLGLDCVGFTGYAKDQYYNGDMKDAEGIDVDPADMFRHIFDHLQSQKYGNLGLIINDTKTPVRIGKPRKTTNFQTDEGEDVSFESGPYKLAWYQTHDLGKELDDLAATTPFEYRTVHRWTGDREMSHRVVIGYPRIGARQHDLRFVVGENIMVVPQIDHNGESYASEITLLGSGEGRKMVRSDPQRNNTGRLRRALVVEEKSEKSKNRANIKALNEVKFRTGRPDLTELVINDHPHAKLGSYNVGDDLPIDTTGGWSGNQQFWVRVLKRTIRPSDGTVTLLVASSEKVA